MSRRIHHRRRAHPDRQPRRRARARCAPTIWRRTPSRRCSSRHPALDAARIADVILGCANQAGEDNRNVARMALLLAGLPHTVPGETVNRLCASGLSAVASAARAIRSGEGDCLIAGGVESMTRAPYVLSKGTTPFARDVQLFDTSLGWRFVNPTMKAVYGTDSMGETAENVAEQYGVSRADQDAFALRSQQRAAAARAAGRLAEEIVPVAIPQKKGDAVLVEQDEFIRPDTSLETLARLKPAFRDGGLGDGRERVGTERWRGGAADGVVERGARTSALTPLARVVARRPPASSRAHGNGTGACLASGACSVPGSPLDQMDVIELNEAFAAQALACLRELGMADDDRARESERRRHRARPPAGHERRATGADGDARAAAQRAGATRCARCASAWGRESR